MSVIKNKIMNIIIVNLAGFVDHRIVGIIQIGFDKAKPFGVKESHIVKRLKLNTNVGKQCFRIFDIRQKLISLIPQIGNQLPFQIRLGLIDCAGLFNFFILVKNNEIIGFCNDFIVAHRGSPAKSYNS